MTTFMTEDDVRHNAGSSTENESDKIGVSSGKFLGFIVTSRGIHLDPNKVKAIQNMHLPKNLKELRGL